MIPVMIAKLTYPIVTNAVTLFGTRPDQLVIFHGLCCDSADEGIKAWLNSYEKETSIAHHWHYNDALDQG